MPNLFEMFGYTVYFWSNENYKPIHVHIAKGNPVKNSTKIWLTKAGKCIVANNKSNIPPHELRKILDIISAERFIIISKWKEFFDVEEVKYYC